MSEYYELYQQCKLERDLLREEIQKRDELLERAKLIINFYQGVTMNISKWDQCEAWLKQYEELKR